MTEIRGFTKHIVDCIDQLVKAKGVTFYKACKESGVSTSSFYEWRSGKTSPTAREAQKLYDYIETLPDKPKE